MFSRKGRGGTKPHQKKEYSARLFTGGGGGVNECEEGLALVVIGLVVSFGALFLFVGEGLEVGGVGDGQRVKKSIKVLPFQVPG